VLKVWKSAGRAGPECESGQGVLEYLIIVILIGLTVLFALRRFGVAAFGRYDCARGTIGTMKSVDGASPVQAGCESPPQAAAAPAPEPVVPPVAAPTEPPASCGFFCLEGPVSGTN